MHNRGFTLIELMIVVSIIGILASIAIPSYQTYIARTQVVEALTVAGELKSHIKDYYDFKGEFPENNGEAGIPLPEQLIGNYVAAIELADGAFHITLGNKANQVLQSKTLTLRPAVVSGSPTSPFSWLCGNSAPVQGMEGVGENRTDIDESMLPTACRDI